MERGRALKSNSYSATDPLTQATLSPLKPVLNVALSSPMGLLNVA